MQIDKIKGYSVIVGESQGYQGLPLRVTQVIDPTNGQPVTQLQSAWRPTEEELMLLNQGYPIIVSIFSQAHPPIRLEVGDTEVN